MTPRPNSNERDRRTAGPGMLLAPWEATAGGVRPFEGRKGASKQIKKRSGGRIKNMQMGLQIGGDKKRGIPLFVSLFRRPGIVLGLPRRKIE